MSKLYFKYGTMQASKSMDIIRTEYNYRTAGKKCLCLIPEIDTRSNGFIKSRAIEESLPATIITKDINLHNIVFSNNYDVVLVDEAQFLTRDFVKSLRDIVDSYDIPVICWGLKSNFNEELFEGSNALLVYADNIEEIKTICHVCGENKALFNVLVDGTKNSGDGILVGDIEFKPMCSKCKVEYNKYIS